MGPLLLLLIADLAAPGSAEKTLGPFATLAAYCQQVREKPAVCREVNHTDGVAIPRVTGAAPFLRVAVLQVGREGTGDYFLAVKTDAGWFVDEDWTLGYSSRGRGYSRVNALSIAQSPLGPILLARTTEAFWRKPETDAQLSDADRFYAIGNLTVCGLGASRHLTCTRAIPIAADGDEVPGDPDEYRFDAWRHPAWELRPSFDRDGVTLAPVRSRQPPRVWGMLSGVYYFLDESERLPGHHPLRFP